MLRVLTFDEMCSAFGDPRPFIGPDGRASRFWEQKILRMARLPAPLPLSWEKNVKVTRFPAHYLLVDHFERAFVKVHENTVAWESIDDFGGCYAFRAVRGDRKALSKHSWAAGTDLDVADNEQGGAGEMHPAIISAFEEEGFIWGGRFSGKRIDPMHFEWGDLDRIMAEIAKGAR